MRSRHTSKHLTVAVFMFALTSNADFYAQQSQSVGYWVDPSTQIMWTAKDSGKDLSWKGAIKYCHSLKLAAHSDWRLATNFELQGIYDPKAKASGLAGLGKGSASTWHVKGNLFLTGYEWGSFNPEDSGKSPGFAFYFNFIDGQLNSDPIGFLYPYDFRRALCVRKP